MEDVEHSQTSREVLMGETQKSKVQLMFKYHQASLELVLNSKPPNVLLTSSQSLRPRHMKHSGRYLHLSAAEWGIFTH